MMSKRTKWIIRLILPVLYLLSAQRSNGQAASLNIREAIDLALTNNRSLQADSLEISITEDRNRQLAGLYRPQVNYSSSMEFNPAIASQMLPGSVAGQPEKDLVAVQFGTRYYLRSGVEVTQTIYRKDLLLQMRSAGLQTNIAQTKYRLSKEELVYQIAAMFYSLQTNAELIRTTEFDYNNMKEILTIAKAQYEKGIMKRVDYESLGINVANMQSRLNQLQTQYNDQLARFNNLLGLPAAAKTIISENISGNVGTNVTGNNLLQREDLRLSSQMLEAKVVELKSIRAEQLPSLNSYFRYSYQSQFNSLGNAFNSDYLYNSSTVGISMTIPIFDGNRRKSRINTAKTQVEQLKLKNRHQVDQAEMELFTAKGTLRNNQEEYLITAQNLELALKVFNSRRALYTEGVTTLVELLDAERELSEARSQHMQALINVQTGNLDVHKANGSLLTQFLKSI